MSFGFWWPPASEEVMTSPPEHQRMEPCDGLPKYYSRSSVGKKEIGLSRSRLAGKSVHAVPLVVLLCLFILWWFCFPVSLEMKQSRIAAMYQTDDLSFNDCAHLEIAVLTEATISPVPAIAPQNFIGQNVTHQQNPRLEVTKNHHNSSVAPPP